MKIMVMCSALLVSALLSGVNAESAMAQYRPGAQSGAASQRQAQTTQGNTAHANASQATDKTAAAKPASPWRMTSRIHLEKGGNKGYLVVQLDLKQ